MGVVALGVALPLAVACGEVTGPDARDGALSFDYESASSGRFEVSADTPRVSVEGVPEFGEWALAAAGDSVGGVVIAALRRAGDGLGDLFILQLAELRSGDFSCAPGLACHGRVLFGIPDHGGLPVGRAERWFEIVSGEVEVSEAGEGRIRGSFVFTARDEGGDGATILTVEDGRFDLPFTGAGTARSVECMGADATGRTCPSSGS